MMVGDDIRWSVLLDAFGPVPFLFSYYVLVGLPYKYINYTTNKIDSTTCGTDAHKI